MTRLSGSAPPPKQAALPPELDIALTHKRRKPPLPPPDLPAEIAALHRPRPKPRPPDDTCRDELGPKRRFVSVKATIAAVLKIYPYATGEFVEGSRQQHRTYWFAGRRVAHSWPARNKPGVWLRLRKTAAP